MNIEELLNSGYSVEQITRMAESVQKKKNDEIQKAQLATKLKSQREAKRKERNERVAAGTPKLEDTLDLLIEAIGAEYPALGKLVENEEIDINEFMNMDEIRQSFALANVIAEELGKDDADRTIRRFLSGL